MTGITGGGSRTEPELSDLRVLFLLGSPCRRYAWFGGSRIAENSRSRPRGSRLGGLLLPVYTACGVLGCQAFSRFSCGRSCVHYLYSVGSQVYPTMVANEKSCRGRVRASEEVR